MSITAIKITAHHGERDLVVTLSDAFNDIEQAINIFNELAEAKEDLDFCDVEVAIEHVEDENPDAVVSEQMRCLTWHFKADEAYTLDMVFDELENMQDTVDSFEGDENALYGALALYGARYLSPGDVVSFIKYTRREMIEREINNISESDRVLNIDKIRHLLDDDAVLSQAVQGDDTVEVNGTYYVFDN
jgi:DNA polymerase elongation subunit (family B)